MTARIDLSLFIYTRMADTPESQESIQLNEHQRLLQQIREHCGLEPEQPVSIIPETEDNTDAEKMANTIYDAMMLTLSEIGEASVTKALAGEQDSDKYAEVAKATEALAFVSRAVADGRVPFVRNNEEIRKRREKGDNVHSYEVRDATLYDGPAAREFRNIKVFIRPERYVERITADQKTSRQDITVAEVGEPRMHIRIVPADRASGQIDIRIDKDRAGEVIFDIEVDDYGQNLMDELDFPDTSQRETHHFSSRLKLNQQDTGFGDVLRVMSSRFDSMSSERSNLSS